MLVPSIEQNFLYDLDVMPGLLDLYLDILSGTINVVRLTLLLLCDLALLQLGVEGARYFWILLRFPS